MTSSTPGRRKRRQRSRIPAFFTLLLGLVLVLAVTVAATDMFFGPDRSRPVNEPAETITSDLSPTALRQRNLLPADDASEAAAAGLLPRGTKSLLNVDRRLRHGTYVWNDTGVPTGVLTVWVDLRRQMVSVFRGGHEIGTAVIVYGAREMGSPEGRFPILSRVRDYHSRNYDAPMPYSLFITNDGVALHGSPMSSRRATHGCIGLPEEFARKLFDVAKVGDIVEISRSNAAAEQRIIAERNKV